MNRFTLTREDYIPAAAKGFEPARPEGTDLEIYSFVNEKGQPAVCAFAGKSAKPIAFYRFTGDDRRTAFVDQLTAQHRARKASKAEAQAKRKSAQHSLEVGDILDSSWGYDQTNVNFYQVVALVGASRKSVKIREIAQCTVEVISSMSERVGPVKGSFLDRAPELLVRVDDQNRCSVKGHAASKWDGKPCYSSSYH